jgi:paraquat-inducible protein B
VLVKVRLRHSAAPIARQGAVFWIVRPEIGLSNIAALGTVITGPEIAVMPGNGKPQSEFVGLESSPVAVEDKGLKVILVSDHLGSLIPSSPVYYRGVEVGTIQDIQLSPDATMVHAYVFIKERYVNLVQNGSKFWKVSGADMSLSLFRGLEVNMESLRTLVVGGIAFATPDDSKAKPAKSGTMFPLYDQPKKEWLKWAPKIRIRREK